MATVIKRESGKRNTSKLFTMPISSMGVDAINYCGVIESVKNPLVLQKELRDEWQ